MTCLTAAAVALCLIAAPGEVRVIDGDTLALPGIRVRLWGIDAPELAIGRGIVARAALRDLVAGQWLGCEVVDRDRYGRAVARCGTAAIPDLAAALVCAGHARDWSAYSGGHYGRVTCR